MIQRLFNGGSRDLIRACNRNPAEPLCLLRADAKQGCFAGGSCGICVALDAHNVQKIRTVRSLQSLYGLRYCYLFIYFQFLRRFARSSFACSVRSP
jgi:hypothetical protein